MEDGFVAGFALCLVAAWCASIVLLLLVAI